MTKREKKYFIDQYVNARNLADWFEHRKNRTGLEGDELAYVEERYVALDREALTIGGIAIDLNFWDEMWNTYYDQRTYRSY
jgi:hypothetical protein